MFRGKFLNIVCIDYRVYLEKRYSKFNISIEEACITRNYCLRYTNVNLTKFAFSNSIVV